VSTVKQRALRLGLFGAAALTFLVAPAAIGDNAAAQPAVRQQAQPCINGVIPGNPYIVNCNLPRRTPQVAGAAPDAGAIIACRNIPGCLSWYVNHPH
jgi:hypothetical protein